MGHQNPAAVETSTAAADWSQHLSQELGVPVRVAFGTARRNVLVARPEGAGYRVRMHAGFAQAPEEVRGAVARWLRSGQRARRASRLLDEWIDEVLIPSFPSAKPVACEPRGEHHDLKELGQELHLEGHLPELEARDRWPGLTWGRRRRTGARRSLHLGSYDRLADVVRVHRVLDQPGVPRFFVRYVLFHELLHAALPPVKRGGRTLHHPEAFRRREQAYPDFERAKGWEDRNVGRLLRSTRTGRDLPPERRPKRGLGALAQLLLFD